MTELLAVLAAIANAVSSVLQRRADRDEPVEPGISLRLIGQLLRRPTWLFGILAVIVGFLLQAGALSTGPIAVVEPVLILELPLTLFVAALVFHRQPRRVEWAGAAAITVGLGALLFALAPTGGDPQAASGAVWAIGSGISLVVIGGLVAAAGRTDIDGRRSALLGVATGTAFGLTAAYIAAMTSILTTHGVVAALTTWQIYAMIVSGLGAMILLQNALNAGPLVAAQPGFTAADPIVSILWGILGFGEHARTGGYVAFAIAASVVIAVGMTLLSRSPAVTGAESAQA